MADFTYRTLLQRNLTAAEVDANFAGLANQAWHRQVATAANGDTTLALRVPYGGRIVSMAFQCDSGTVTAAIKVNATTVGIAQAVTSTVSLQSPVVGNTFVAGDKIVLTLSANAAALGFAASIAYVRTQT